MGVVGMGMGLYPWDLKGFAREKEEEKPQYVDCVKSLPRPLPPATIAKPTKDKEMDKSTENVETYGLRICCSSMLKKFERGIAIILVQEDKNSNVFNKPNAKNLKVQIPSDPFSLNGSPKGDFGIRTRNLFNPDDMTPVGVRSPGYVTGPLSIKEMELSEEYTRVICHGPNPKTTHIYDNCVVDSCCGILVGSPPPLALESGLSFCQTCKKKIGDGCDIFMYRGEKAFCSEECRCQEMILDGLMST
nr:hypothetical protein [Tanacetum cinerariifolium]